MYRIVLRDYNVFDSNELINGVNEFEIFIDKPLDWRDKVIINSLIAVCKSEQDYNYITAVQTVKTWLEEREYKIIEVQESEFNLGE